MSDWRPGGRHGEIDEGFGQMEFSTPEGVSKRIPVIGRHQALAPSGNDYANVQFGPEPPYRQPAGVDPAEMFHEWDFQALSEELDRPEGSGPGADVPFDFEKRFADALHPRREPYRGTGEGVSYRPMLRYEIESPDTPTSAYVPPLLAVRMTRRSHMREVEHPPDLGMGAARGLAARVTQDHASVEDEIEDYDELGETRTKAKAGIWQEGGSAGGTGPGIAKRRSYRGSVNSLIEQHSRWLEDIENYTAEERLRTGEGL